jgi:hypothetical protein
MPIRTAIASIAGLVVLGSAFVLLVVMQRSGGDGPLPGPESGYRFEAAGGSPQLSEADALSAAASSNLGLAETASSATARFVLISNDLSGEYGFDRDSVWLVTYRGVNLPAHGGNPAVNHEANVIVDANSGEPLLLFSYR